MPSAENGVRRYYTLRLKRLEYKIQIVINKADLLSNQQLLRVYGAVMWSLAKVFKRQSNERSYEPFKIYWFILG